jgi:glycosyltransferase involved in cell wall biosynthesis
MESQLISVIVRAKNEEAWIRRCLAGVKAQRVDHDIEVVLVDNMSTDLTVAKAQSVWP